VVTRTLLHVTLYVHGLSCYGINVEELSRFSVKTKISVHPYVTILEVFALYVAVLAFPLYPKVMRLIVLLY